MKLDVGVPIVIVFGVVGLELLQLIVRHAFKRFTSPEFVTKKECVQCDELKDAALGSLKAEIGTINGSLKAEISTIKEILIVMATKVGVDEKDLKKLVR